ncbi:unnamed protein product [Cyprideis torosa]|uniref:Uncharacterized protein n=1 Tax=Cyprideis torosa TaxID=163714 RepID=A0A7R8ZG18_9CRUS|nr:unnamed protein product [Cyprideis torosa]CAG0880529.1 unnamed protein product [Cyprideis torosa]
MLVQPQPQTQADSSQLNHGELRGLEELLSVCAEYEKQLDSERCPRTSPSSHGNRIKTNGSLPRDKPSSPDVPFRECSVGVNGASESMNGNTSPAMRHHPNSFSLPRLKNHSEGIPSPPEGGTSPRNKIRTNLFCYDKRGVGAASSPGLGSASLNGKLLDRSDPNSVNGSLSSVPDSFGTTSVDGFTTASFSRVQLMATVMNGNHGSAPVQETKGFASVSNPPRPPACTVTSVHGNFPFASNNTPCVSSTTVLSLAVINSSSSSYHRNQTFLTSDPQQFYPPVPAAPLVSSESESSVSSPSPANSVKRAVPPTSQGTAGDRTSTTSSREELLRTAASLKARIQQIEKKATEVVQEVEVERALLLAELSEEREVLSREEQKLLALQKREEREREEMIRKRKEVEDTWKRMEAAEAAARKERDAVSNSPEEDEERQRKIRQFEEVADVERRTFEDLEFHLLETEAVRETEREEAAREAKLLEERSQARRWEVAALIRQQTEMVRAARKETAALENERRQLISEVDQIRSLIPRPPRISSCAKDENTDLDKVLSLIRALKYHE